MTAPFRYVPRLLAFPLEGKVARLAVTDEGSDGKVTLSTQPSSTTCGGPPSPQGGRLTKTDVRGKKLHRILPSFRQPLKNVLEFLKGVRGELFAKSSPRIISFKNF